MDLKTYFDNTEGRGVLATADKDGRVDVAIYSRPHVMDDGTVAFIMRDRLTHHNIQSNPHAAFLYMEAANKPTGKRLFLTKIGEETDREKIETLRRRKNTWRKASRSTWSISRWTRYCRLSGRNKKTRI